MGDWCLVSSEDDDDDRFVLEFGLTRPGNDLEMNRRSAACLDQLDAQDERRYWFAVNEIMID